MHEQLNAHQLASIALPVMMTMKYITDDDGDDVDNDDDDDDDDDDGDGDDDGT